MAVWSGGLCCRSVRTVFGLARLANAPLVLASLIGWIYYKLAATVDQFRLYSSANESWVLLLLLRKSESENLNSSMESCKHRTHMRNCTQAEAHIQIIWTRKETTRPQPWNTLNPKPLNPKPLNPLYHPKT